MNIQKRVFVSGCYDPIHAGHIRFFEIASSYGDLYVSIGSDRTIEELKGRKSYTTEKERLYHLKSIKFIHEVLIGTGRGILDFEPEIRLIKPDLFIVNEEGAHESKRKLCEALGIEYLVLKREPLPGLPERTSTYLRNNSRMPYRIDLAGGWLDQPFVSKHTPGPVITISVIPSHDFCPRSGMACSTREKALRLWGDKEPPEDEEAAKMLFAYENPPGSKEKGGSQDSIGIVFPGLNKLDYESGEHWPRKITSVNDDEILNWLESKIHLIPLKPREEDFRVLSQTNINETYAKNLSSSSKNCFDSIINRNLEDFGRFVTESFEAQKKMFPLTTNQEIDEKINIYKDVAKGWKLLGAGGGGYLLLVSDSPIENSIRIKIRRKNQ